MTKNEQDDLDRARLGANRMLKVIGWPVLAGCSVTTAAISATYAVTMWKSGVDEHLQRIDDHMQHQDETIQELIRTIQKRRPGEPASY